MLTHVTKREQLFVQGQMACDAALVALLPALEQRINVLLPATAAKQLKEELAQCNSKGSTRAREDCLA